MAAAAAAAADGDEEDENDFCGDKSIAILDDDIAALDEKVANISLRDGFDRASFALRQVELIRTVGTGTFGRVMSVRNKCTSVNYALKILAIEDIIRLKQVEHVKNEKLVLDQIDHPFLVTLFWTSHDIKFLYMLFEYVCGGELFTYLRNAGKFSNVQTRFFAAEIVSALVYLHGKSIIYRDLKPENILLDLQGHVKITDFGFAKVLKDRTYTMCGTPEYLAPEIIQGKGYNKTVDWWALGVLCFEMLTGCPPFYDDTPILIYQKIIAGNYEFVEAVDSDAKNLVDKLLIQDRTKRLGSMKAGGEDVQAHVWFNNIDWAVVAARGLVPIIVPHVSGPGDTRCYDTYDEMDWKKVPTASLKAQALFKDF